MSSHRIIVILAIALFLSLGLNALGEEGLFDELRGIVIIDTVVVDAVANALPEGPSSSCNGTIAFSEALSPGRYVVGITGGPGLSHHYHDNQYSVAFVIPATIGHPWFIYGGLYGLAKPSDSATYYIFKSEYIETWIGFYITAYNCDSNEGYVEVSIGRFE
jgi:hypothetical protein